MFKRVISYIKVVAVVALLPLIGLSIVACGQGGDEDVMQEITVQVTRGDLEKSVSFSGRIIFPESTRESFLVAGTVGSVEVAEGDTVVEGQVLARLTNSDIAEKEAQLDELAVALANAEERLDPDIMDSIGYIRENTEEEYQDTISRWTGSEPDEDELLLSPATLFERWGVDLEAAYGGRYNRAGYEQDNPETRLNEAVVRAWRELFPGQIELICEEEEAMVDHLCIMEEIEDSWTAYSQSQSEYSQQETLIRVARTSLDRAISDLGETELIASTNGLVKSVTIEEGDDSTGGDSGSIDIENQEIVEMSGNVAELDISSIVEGAQALVTINAFSDRRIEGVVDKIESITGTIFEATVVITPPDDLLIRAGLNASARVLAASYSDVLLVPATAILGTLNAPFVNVRVNEDTLEQRSITLGDSDGTLVIVESGLSEGDNIVLPALAALEEQQQFSPRGPGGAPTESSQ